jgi:predicted TPR repeat methyltransferase
MPNPTVNPVILLSPVENGYVAYDPVSDRLHQLNPIAALLTELCDGNRSIDDIRELARPLIPEGKVGEIDRWIDEGMKVGLLVWHGSEPASHRELSAAELYTLTKRLREKGKVQTAYVCGKRAVELKPDDWDAWYDLGEIAQCVGRRREAREAYQKYFDVHPEDAEIEHLLLALRDETPPPRASDRTIQQIYKSFARSYDSRMREDLKYQGPERVEEAIKSVIGDRVALSVLDLGCGSGLAGAMLKQFASTMVGVDLSPEMIELARARNIYDHFEVAEITEWLERGGEQFDLISSSDCLIYFGDLNRIVSAAGNRLKPGGVFALSTERGNRYPFHLTDTGRYEHHPDHVREAAAKAGLTVGHLDEKFLRMEYGSEVMGIYAALKKVSGGNSVSH